MSATTKSVLWWIFAVVFTVVAAEYQKMTGPTYPVNGKTKINNQEVKYSLIRTAENDKDAEISIEVPDESVSGTILYKRFKSNDSITSAQMLRSGKKLSFMMPKQPAAGKIMYKIILSNGVQQTTVAAKNDNFIVMRFKGPVPLYVLIPHILCMFLGLLFSSRTAIESLIKGVRTYKYAIMSLVFLIPGGLILGPLVQKYAFDAYWTGWPFGHDLTDNKTLVMVLAWAFAAYKLKRDPSNKLWPVAAALIVLVVYLIPHSMFGSEIDYTKVPVK
ncbi:MAG: hypothetical protein HXX13_00845 [Bacteroidetes bacterium]|nr:hypothetical protein [Bacteroidota bacterium]